MPLDEFQPEPPITERIKRGANGQPLIVKTKGVPEKGHITAAALKAGANRIVNRPKVITEWRQEFDRIRQEVWDENAMRRACERLLELIDSDEEKTALHAIGEFFNRVAGRPAQSIDITHTAGIPLDTRIEYARRTAGLIFTSGPDPGTIRDISVEGVGRPDALPAEAGAGPLPLRRSTEGSEVRDNVGALVQVCDEAGDARSEQASDS